MKNKQKEDDFQLSLQLKTIMNDLKCPSSHPINRICDNNSCQSSALFCIEKQCEDCINAHQKCRSYSFQMFTKLVQKRSTGPIAQFLDKIIEIENSMIDAIRKQKRKLSQSFIIDQLSTSLDKKYYKLVQDIYKYKNSKAINGRQANNELFQKLRETQIEAESRQEELLQTFNQQAQKIQKQYLQVKSWIYDAVFAQQRYKKKTKEKAEDIMAIQSKVLKTKNDEMTLKELMNSTNKKIAMFSTIIEQQLQLQDKLFLREMLTLPTLGSLKFQIAFRASQNDFSANRFHQVCDNIEDTFVVARNEFGKIFGGFTSLTWFGENTFKNDQHNTSFLISFNEKIKMTIFNKSKAIFCSHSLGPTFGGDSNFIKFFSSYDLQIGDKCHTNASSYYDYPKSYQFFQRSTDPINIFGIQKRKKFKISQYEVFKVTFRGL